MNVLRWIAVLPAASASNALVAVLVAIFRPLLMFLFGVSAERSGGYSYDDTYGPVMADAFGVAAQSFVWVFVGAWVAPKHRSHVAVALCSIYVMIVIYGAFMPSAATWTTRLFSYIGTILGLVLGVAKASDLPLPGSEPPPRKSY